MLPTNIPAVRANELRLNNLFELADGTVALVDYESEYKKGDKVKYLKYLTGIVNRYQKEKKDCPGTGWGSSSFFCSGCMVYCGDWTKYEKIFIYFPLKM